MSCPSSFPDSRSQRIHKKLPLPVGYLERLPAKWASGNCEPRFCPVRNHVTRVAIGADSGFPGLD